MISQIFKTGGGAGIGSYVLVIKNGVLLNPKAEKIRWAYDSGENLFLSIIDDTTEEALLPLTGYVDKDDVLHLSGRDFDDNLTYQIEINGKTHTIETNLVEGITLGEGTIGTGTITIPEYTLDGDEPSQELLEQIYNDRPVMFKLHIEGGSYDRGSYDENNDFFFYFGCESTGKIKLGGKRRDYSIISYYSINPFSEMEKGSYDPHIDTDNPRGITLYFGKVEGFEKYLFDSDSFAVAGVDRKDVESMIWDFWWYTAIPYIDSHGGNPRTQQMTATIVIDPITNLNGRKLTKYSYGLDQIGGYTVIKVYRQGMIIDPDTAADYMEYMTGSRYVPMYNYEHPQNSLWIMPNGTLWKPQWDKSNGMVLWAIPNPFLSSMELHPDSFDIDSAKITLSNEEMNNVVNVQPELLMIEGMGFYLQGVEDEGKKAMPAKLYKYTGFDLRTSGKTTMLLLTFRKAEYQYPTCELEVIAIGGDTNNYATDEQIDELFAVYYKITKDVGAGVTVYNPETSIRENNNYYSLVHINRPFIILDNFYVLMDGEDITSMEFGSYDDQVWDGERINVPDVTGDLVIQAETHDNPNIIPVDLTLTNCYVSNGTIPPYVDRGSKIDVVVEPTSPYIDVELHAWVDGIDVTSNVWNPTTRELVITDIQDPVTIVANGYGGAASVYFDLNGCYATNGSPEVTIGTSYYNQIHSDTGVFNSVYFGMVIDGVEQSIYGDGTYNYVHYSDKMNAYIMDIPTVTGNIAIICSAQFPMYNVSLDLGNYISARNYGSETMGGYEYTNVFTLAKDQELATSIITMGGEDASQYFAWNDKEQGYKLNIPRVTGDISVYLRTADEPGPVPQFYSITYDLGEKITSSNTADTIAGGSTYLTVLRAPFHFEYGVFMGEKYVGGGTSDYESDMTGERAVISVSSVSDNLVIQAKWK